KSGALQLRRRVELDVAGEDTPVKDFDGERLADLLLVNDLDLTYAKIRLDERSLSTATEHLAELCDPLARAITVAALCDLLSAARTPEHLSFVRGLLDGIKVFTGLKVDTDLRWSIVNALAGVGQDDGLIDAELKRDPTDEGHRHAAAARAARPTAEAKEQVWASLMEDLTLPLATMRSMMRGFHRFDQRRV